MSTGHEPWALNSGITGKSNRATKVAEKWRNSVFPIGLLRLTGSRGYQRVRTLTEIVAHTHTQREM